MGLSLQGKEMNRFFSSPFSMCTPLQLFSNTCFIVRLWTFSVVKKTCTKCKLNCPVYGIALFMVYLDSVRDYVEFDVSYKAIWR